MCLWERALLWGEKVLWEMVSGEDRGHFRNRYTGKLNFQFYLLVNMAFKFFVV